MKYKLYEVGGRVRDRFLGIESNDVDYSVVIDTNETDVTKVHNQFVAELKKQGYGVHIDYPETLTTKAKFPKGHKHEGLTADFVICRNEIGYIAGTRQPRVVLGTLLEDLLRRDFTVNAMAEAEDGSIIDPFGGEKDLLFKVLRTPSDTVASFNDDPLRILRAFRFAVTKDLNWSDDIVTAIKLFHPEKMDVISMERIRAELEKMFKHDTLKSWRYLRWLEDMNPKLFSSLFRDGMWLLPTTKR